jgi:hypothetical protein
MRLVAFTLPADPSPRTGVLAHDGARVVDLTEIGVASFAEGAARAGRLAQLAGHLLHVPGAVAHLPAAVRLLAPVGRLVAVYDSATGRPAPPLAEAPTSGIGAAPEGPESAVPLAPGAALGVGVVGVLGRPAEGLAAGDVEAHLAGIALLVCWRAPSGRLAGAVVGPWLATLDEFPPAKAGPLAFALDAALALNGGLARGGSWAALTGKLAGAVAAASAQGHLVPGDAVGVATFETGGDDADVPPGSSPGDEVVLEATGLGALRAYVAPGLGAAAATER